MKQSEDFKVPKIKPISNDPLGSINQFNQLCEELVGDIQNIRNKIHTKFTTDEIKNVDIISNNISQSKYKITKNISNSTENIRKISNSSEKLKKLN